MDNMTSLQHWLQKYSRKRGGSGITLAIFAGRGYGYGNPYAARYVNNKLRLKLCQAQVKLKLGLRFRLRLRFLLRLRLVLGWLKLKFKRGIHF